MFKKKYLGKSKLPQASVCVKCQIVMRGVQMYSTGCWPDTSHSRYLQLPQVCGLDYNSYWMLHDCTQKLNYYYYFTCWQIICRPTHLHITTTTTNILITLNVINRAGHWHSAAVKYRCSFKCHIYMYIYITVSHWSLRQKVEWVVLRCSSQLCVSGSLHDLISMTLIKGSGLFDVVFGFSGLLGKEGEEEDVCLTCESS